MGDPQVDLFGMKSWIDTPYIGQKGRGRVDHPIEAPWLHEGSGDAFFDPPNESRRELQSLKHL